MACNSVNSSQLTVNRKTINHKQSTINLVRCHPGFTLVEILLGTALVGVIAFLMASVFIAHFKLFYDQNSVIDIASQNKLALDEITNQIRQSESVVTTCANNGCPDDVTGPNVIVLRLWPINSSGEIIDAQGTNYDYVVYKREPASVTSHISTSTDDVNEDDLGGDGSFDLITNLNVWAGTGESTSHSYTGLRFNNLNIPKGAKVTTADIDMYLPQDTWIDTEFDIYAHDIGNSPTFSIVNKPSQRPLTGKKISYQNPEGNMAHGRWYSVGDVGSIVQEVVNRSDWVQNGSITFIFKGTHDQPLGRKFFASYDTDLANAPRLNVTINEYPRLIKKVIPSLVSSRSAESRYMANNVTNVQFAYNTNDATQASEIASTITTTSKFLAKTNTLTQSATAILRNK